MGLGTQCESSTIIKPAPLHESEAAANRTARTEPKRPTFHTGLDGGGRRMLPANECEEDARPAPLRRDQPVLRSEFLTSCLILERRGTCLSPFPIRSSPFPSPRPSPLGRGRTFVPLDYRSRRAAIFNGGAQSTLSPRERAGVRGKETHAIYTVLRRSEAALPRSRRPPSTSAIRCSPGYPHVIE